MVFTFLGCILCLIGDVPMVFSYDIYISRLLFLIGDVPMVLSYGIYISRLYFIFDWWRPYGAILWYLHFSVVMFYW